MPSPSAPVRFGVVSPGRWGQKLLEAVRNSTDLSFAGIASRDEAKRTEIAARYGGRAYPSYEALLADPAIEAVVLPTPHFLHHAQAMAALNAGKHVFVEKPIATTVAEGEEMQRLSRARGLVLAVGHQGRFTGMARRVREMLAAGEFGQMVGAAVVQGYPLLLNATADNWRTSLDHIPGGPLDEFGVHTFDVLQYWFGPVKRVTGLVNAAITPNPVPDAAGALLEFGNGMVVTYLTYLVSVGLSRMTLYGTRGALEIRRFGQEGGTWFPLTDMAAARAALDVSQPVTFPGPMHLDSALTAELESFARSVRTGAPVEVGAEESLATLRISRAILEASNHGRTVCF